MGKRTTSQRHLAKRPETAQERLAELMVRHFGLDIQINVTAFACFLCLLLGCEEFACMPWDERQKLIFERFGVEIAESTLRKWASRLLETDVIHKGKGGRVYWRTERLDDEVFRDPVAVNDEEYLRYKERRSELITEYKGYGMEQGKAWGEAFKQLWREFHCCYYACPQFKVNALGHDIDEVIAWTEAVCGEMEN